MSNIKDYFNAILGSQENERIVFCRNYVNTQFDKIRLLIRSNYENINWEKTLYLTYNELNSFDRPNGSHWLSRMTITFNDSSVVSCGIFNLSGFFSYRIHFRLEKSDNPVENHKAVVFMSDFHDYQIKHQIKSDKSNKPENKDDVMLFTGDTNLVDCTFYLLRGLYFEYLSEKVKMSKFGAGLTDFCSNE